MQALALSEARRPKAATNKNLNVSSHYPRCLAPSLIGLSGGIGLTTTPGLLGTTGRLAVGAVSPKSFFKDRVALNPFELNPVEMHRKNVKVVHRVRPLGWGTPSHRHSF